MMKKILAIAVWLWATNIAFAQSGISISPTGVEADPSAMLDVVSTSKGVLIPRMVSTQRVGIASPAVGLLVFENKAPEAGR